QSFERIWPIHILLPSETTCGIHSNVSPKIFKSALHNLGMSSLIPCLMSHVHLHLPWDFRTIRDNSTHSLHSDELTIQEVMKQVKLTFRGIKRPILFLKLLVVLNDVPTRIPNRQRAMGMRFPERVCA
ncbi:MAG: hypothetical protein HW374_1221, partial [Bacteroidetes bacterium]|nr:hypothetical protein [Bacteroidota bacterium]